MANRKLRTRLEILSVAVMIAGAAALLWWAVGSQMSWGLFSDRERLRQVIEGLGPLAPVVFVLMLVVQAVLAPLPAPALAAAGGYAFGTLYGFVLTWIGALLGGVLCFWISRLLGREHVARNARFNEIDRQVTEHGAILVFVLRLIPLVSFDAISYAVGLTGLSFTRFLIASALGSAPGTFVFVYLGGASPGPGLYVAFAMLAALAFVAYAYYRRLRRKR